jgi:arsenate reductase
MIVYGIKNCDTVKKTLDWLKAKKIGFEFHNYKTDGISEATLKNWVKQVGWEVLVNKKGTTWKGLDDTTKNKINDNASAIKLMAEKTSVIKRPVIEKDGKVVAVGFDAAAYELKF